MKKRVVITAVGVISPLGRDSKEIHASVASGTTVSSLTHGSQSHYVNAIESFNLKEYVPRCKERRYLNRASQLSLAAASLCINDSGLSQQHINNSGLFIGTGPNLSDYTDIRKEQALWMLHYVPNTAAAIIAKQFGIHGQNLTVGTACAASLQAIGEAFHKIKHGELRHAFVGGGDSRLSENALQAYADAGVLFTGNSPDEYIPFGAQCKTGFIPGEGAAFFLLEEYASARKRNARIYAEITGYGNSLDGHSMTDPHPEGVYLRQAINSALQEARLTPEDIELVAAHGTGTAVNDFVESSIISQVFSAQKTAVTALKSWVGHCAAACGAVELAVLLSALEQNSVPHIRNLRKSIESTIRFLTEPYTGSPEHILLQNSGFGGQNCALIINRI